MWKEYLSTELEIRVLLLLLDLPHPLTIRWQDSSVMVTSCKISESPVYNFKDLKSIEKLKENYRINDVLFAIENDVQSE